MAYVVQLIAFLVAIVIMAYSMVVQLVSSALRFFSRS
jgi:hypothetical protein